MLKLNFALCILNFELTLYKMNIIITGGAGFIGANFILHFLEKYPEATVINVDKLTYAANLDNLKEVENDPRYVFEQADIAHWGRMEEIFDKYRPDSVIHIAAETHVDRSIQDAAPFIESNIVGTHNLLECSRKYEVRKFVYVSTDEVYGTLGDTGVFTEETLLQPNNPYSATKAGAEMLVRSYMVTHNFPAVITRCSNNYGRFQYPEKLIPYFVKRALNGETLPVYGDGQNIREWIHVTDHCKGIELVWDKGKIGEVYNIGSGNEIRNIDVAKQIVKHLGLDESIIEFVVDRPGHDYRYANDCSKIKDELGWREEMSFEEGMKDTIRWYQAQFSLV